MLFLFLGFAMAQADICRPVTAEARFRFQVSSYEICGGQRGTGLCVSASTSEIPLSIVPPMVRTCINLRVALITRTQD